MVIITLFATLDYQFLNVQYLNSPTCFLYFSILCYSTLTVADVYRKGLVCSVTSKSPSELTDDIMVLFGKDGLTTYIIICLCMGKNFHFTLDIKHAWDLTLNFFSPRMLCSRCQKVEIISCLSSPCGTYSLVVIASLMIEPSGKFKVCLQFHTDFWWTWPQFGVGLQFQTASWWTWPLFIGSVWFHRTTWWNRALFEFFSLQFHSASWWIWPLFGVSLWFHITCWWTRPLIRISLWFHTACWWLYNCLEFLSGLIQPFDDYTTVSLWFHTASWWTMPLFGVSLVSYSLLMNSTSFWNFSQVYYNLLMCLEFLSVFIQSVDELYNCLEFLSFHTACHWV